MKKFKVGDRVGWPDSVSEMIYQEDNEPYYGTISEINEGNIKIKWDDEWARKNYSNRLIKPELLLPEIKCKKDWSRVEKEFAALEAKLSKKIDQAAALLLEANKLASEGGRDLLDMEATYSLLNAMREVGWRTSALNC